MKNDFEFWEEYLNKIKIQIMKICNEKKSIYIDFHIHSNNSADGKQTIKEIIESTCNQKFDIISITDHDTVNGYDELYEIVKKGLTKPLIIPGIEFTMDNREYGNQCHFLQLFINPKDISLKKDILKNYESMFNRSKIQFERIKQNITLQTIFKNNKISVL